MRSFRFSDALIQDTIAYYETRGESLSPETAQEYLHSMSSLYESLMAFAGFESTSAPQEPPPLMRGGGGARRAQSVRLT
jgi:hypothetical protein